MAAAQKGENGVHPAGIQEKPGKDQNASARVPSNKQPKLAPAYTEYKKYDY